MAAAVAAAVVLTPGCQTAKATKQAVYQEKSGTVITNTDTIEVKSFLGKINNGRYSDGHGMILSVTAAGPDQESIAILSGAVVDLAKIAAGKQPTNSPATNAP